MTKQWNIYVVRLSHLFVLLPVHGIVRKVNRTILSCWVAFICQKDPPSTRSSPNPSLTLYLIVYCSFHLTALITFLFCVSVLPTVLKWPQWTERNLSCLFSNQIFSCLYDIQASGIKQTHTKQLNPLNVFELQDRISNQSHGLNTRQSH